MFIVFIINHNQNPQKLKRKRNFLKQNMRISSRKCLDICKMTRKHLQTYHPITIVFIDLIFIPVNFLGFS